MPNRSIVMKSLSAALVLIAPGMWGQGGKKPIEPKSPSVLYYLDSSDQLVPLESQVIRIHHKYRALGFAGGTTVYLVTGEKSPMETEDGGQTTVCSSA